jgi:hypothetical protein
MLYTRGMKLNGLPLSINLKVDKFVAFLESLPDDEVKTISELVQSGIINRKNTLKDWARESPKLSFYSYRVPSGGGFWVFGNPRAISSARKQTERKLGGK